jgi:pyridinium-3,5-bisthiocarboxylic acid mononucleotide nickel chelatase
MRIAYLDCFSGISGDMFLGALLDAGLPSRVLEETVAELNRKAALDVRFETSRVGRNGISATKVDVWVGGERDEPRLEHHRHQPHRHGHTHEHAHENVLGHEHRHTSAPGTAVLEHTHSQRGLREIREIISATTVTPAAKQKAIAIFEALAAAEARVHNTDIEKIHFHEVGAADAIVDIVCAAVGSEALEVDEWICSPLNLGSGTVQCAHGEFPVPAPATAELLKDAPVYSSGIQAELVTPTGAAIVRVLANRFGPLPQLMPSGIGYGAGTRDFDGHANVLRVLIGDASSHVAPNSESVSGIAVETIAVLEANLDDLSPQILGYTMERLLAEGALDVFYTPAQMKKSRPGMLLTVLANTTDVERLSKILFSETTTLGLRVREEKRLALARRWERITTPWGEVRIKIAEVNGASTNSAPEYEDCRRIAREHQIPLKTVMQEVQRLYLEKQNG